MQAPSGTDFLDRFRWNDIFFQLAIGVEDTVDKKTTDSSLIHVEERIAPNKSSRRTELVVILKQEEIDARTVRPKKLSKELLVLCIAIEEGDSDRQYLAQLDDTIPVRGRQNLRTHPLKCLIREVELGPSLGCRRPRALERVDHRHGPRR